MIRRDQRDKNGQPPADVILASLARVEPDGSPSTVRLTVSTTGRIVHARKWLRGRDGAYRPTKDGVVLKAVELTGVIAALEKARKLLDGDQLPGPTRRPKAAPASESDRDRLVPPWEG